jgi:hemerythrin
MMRRFSLTPDLITGVAEIDAQHRALLALANQVLDTPDEASPATFLRAVSFLARYIVDHFAAEEAVMAQAGYPGARFHLEFHARLRRETAEIVTCSQREGASKKVKLAVSFMLEDWLIYHIRETDRELANFLRDHSAGGTVLRLPEIRPLRSTGDGAGSIETAIAAVARAR